MGKIVQYITYAGEKWPIRTSYYALKMFETETNKKIDELDNDMSLLEVLLWYSLVAGHTAEKKAMTLKRDDMEFILDESMDEFNGIIISSFAPSDGASDDADVKKK